MTVQHIVMIEFKDGTSDEAITEALNAVGGLKDKIEGVLEVQSGKDFSGRSGNFTHGIICLLYTSPSPRDRQKSRMPSSA